MRIFLKTFTIYSAVFNHIKDRAMSGNNLGNACKSYEKGNMTKFEVLNIAFFIVFSKKFYIKNLGSKTKFHFMSGNDIRHFVNKISRLF